MIKKLYRPLKKSGYMFALVLALGLAVGCGTAAPEPQSVSDTVSEVPAGRPIVWSKVDSEPTDAIGKWQPIVDYLAANLSDSGIDAGVVKIAPDTETVSQWIASGEVDLVIDSFYPAMIVADHSGALPLAIRFKGKPERHAVFFARADSGITSIDQLKGETIALTERDSTSGFMLPVAYMKQRGINPVEKEAMGLPLVQNEVGYTFAGDDDVAVQWVLNGTAIAGAVDNDTFGDFVADNPKMLTVLAETEGMVRDTMLLASKDIDPALRDAIKALLLDMDESEEGRAILEGNKALSFEDVHAEVEAAWVKTSVFFDLINN